jgi:hypothetical protein
MLGGAASDYVVIGGGYLQQRAFALSSEDSVVDGDEPDLEGYGLTLHSLAFVIDCYLQREAGVHLQGWLGPAQLHVRPPSNEDGSSATGWLVQLGGGYDWRLGRQVSLGALASISHARLGGRETFGASFALRTVVPGLYLSLSVG